MRYLARRLGSPESRVALERRDRLAIKPGATGSPRQSYNRCLHHGGLPGAKSMPG